MPNSRGSRAGDNQEQQALQRYLRRAEEQARHWLSVGGCGHLLISDAEQAHARRLLEEQLLPPLADTKQRWQLLSGMAPGADLLFVETLSRWLQARGIEFDLIAILPVPAEYLISDWQLRCEQEQLHVSAITRRRVQAQLEAQLAQAREVIPLFGEDDGPAQFRSRRYRQHQYQRLAAILAQHPELLFGIVRPQRGGAPGGSLEVLGWREDRRRIPSDLRLHRNHCAAQPRTLVVNLSESAGALRAGPDDPVQRVLQRTQEASQSGNALACLDIVRAAQRQGLQDVRLDYQLIQALANTGNTQQALNHYRELDLGPEAHSEDWLALRGRLEKDLALRAQPRSWRQFARAAEAYEAAFKRHGGYYSAINAASMRLLAGQARQAHKLAEQTLELLAVRSAPDEIERYYQHVTRAEALLLLGDAQACALALRQANPLLPQDTLRRSRTQQQLHLLCQELGLSTAPLRELQLPPVVLLRQHGRPPRRLQRTQWPAPLRELIAQRSFINLCLQTPGDLLLCERLHEQGARLYLTLPVPAPELVRRWRQPSPHKCEERLTALLDKAQTVIVQRGFLPREQSWQNAEAQALTLGLSVLTAARTAMQWRLLELSWNEDGPRCLRSELVAEPAREAARAYALAGLPTVKPSSSQRRMAGLIFADFSGFARLQDSLYPRYYREVIGGLARLLDRHGQTVRVRKTWGDALHVVTDDASSAALIAVEVQAFMEKHRLRHDGMLGDLELRVAAHYAPVFSGYDEVEHLPAHFGTQLAFAARIEPVAPPGSIYVTENFAARLSFESPQRYILEYAGEVELAKHYGAYRLFALRAR